MFFGPSCQYHRRILKSHVHLIEWPMKWKSIFHSQTPTVHGPMGLTIWMEDMSPGWIGTTTPNSPNQLFLIAQLVDFLSRQSHGSRLGQPQTQSHSTVKLRIIYSCHVPYIIAFLVVAKPINSSRGELRSFTFSRNSKEGQKSPPKHGSIHSVCFIRATMKSDTSWKRD